MDLPETTLPLGSFSLSLAVEDLEASSTFYETLGFTVMGGERTQGWLILHNGTVAIGLFQKMFPNNTITFNPGWGEGATPLEDFVDVREIQARLQAAGITLTQTTDPDGQGPAHIVAVDPDGNPVLIDQHVARPGVHAES